MRLPVTFFALSSLLLGSACVPAVIAGGSAGAVTVAQERTAGHAVDDAGILITIKNLFIKEENKDVLWNVSVNVVEGRVLLTGDVVKPEDSIRAVELSWRAEGVREVINELQVRDKTGFLNYAQDYWITTQIKTRMLATKGIRSINYNVDTVNGVVYIMGLAESQFELDSVLLMARTTKYVQQVINHARLRSDTRRNADTAQ